MTTSLLCKIIKKKETKKTEKSVIVNFTVVENSYEGMDKETKKPRYTNVYFDCVAFGQRAKYVDENIEIGDIVFLEATIKQNNWKDKKTGDNRSKHVLYINKLNKIKHPTNKNGDTLDLEIQNIQF